MKIETLIRDRARSFTTITTVEVETGEFGIGMVGAQREPVGGAPCTPELGREAKKSL